MHSTETGTKTSEERHILQTEAIHGICSQTFSYAQGYPTFKLKWLSKSLF